MISRLIPIIAANKEYYLCATNAPMHQCMRLSISACTYALVHQLCSPLIMFTQFLHPELVLFGQFDNPTTLKCKHKYEHKDGEIIVHQLINRNALATNNLLNQFMQMFSQKNTQQDEHNHWDDHHHNQDEEYQYHKHYYHQQQGYSDNQEDWQEQRPGYDGYFEQDSNPYADQQVYGLTMDAQYLPEQLNALCPPPINDKTHSMTIPFQQQSSKQNREQQGQDGDQQQGWITEQEEQYYVNQQLQQAAGNFATDFVADAFE